MKGALESFARRWWDGELGASGRVLSVLSMPLSWAWALATAGAGLRRAFGGSQPVDGLSVISVGNLAVGGTGKTPFVGWVAGTLSAAGSDPTILVGGHGRDEALLHVGRLPSVPCITNRDRVAGARAARAAGARCAVLDDGFQHRRLERDLDVVLLAAEDPFPGPLLPRGPYRECPAALKRADVVLVTRRAATVESSRALAARIEATGVAKVTGGVELATDGWTDLDARPVDAPTGDVLAACGIARPSAFRSAIERAVPGSVELVAFPDHHEYTPADLARLVQRAHGRPIVITEKDAVKLRALQVSGDVRVLNEVVRWDWGEDAFIALLKGATSPASRT